MIKHVVLMKFKPGASEARFADMEEGLKSLPGVISEIKSYEFGLDVVRGERSYDFALIAEFENLGSLKGYQEHPDHLAVVEIIREICENMVAVDFTC
ncbi:MAG: stress responsive alpha-beta barrel domain-containing protein [Desulfobacteraceae bacterium 4572_88]|nr:MAG: stress responsive alpha-beta barrel domain-containing protein [Desulfobacteraceae bacterium 4572_88]